MSRVEQSIEVNVPVTTAYNQWTQFEEFPRFMEGIKDVRQLDDKTLEWTAEIRGQEETWISEITEQEPDERITWHSTSGRQNAGGVFFERVGDNRTRVRLQMKWDPEGVIENAGDLLQFDEGQIKGDLERFKEYIEARGTATGAWRGEIDSGQRVR
jgi:uncharacterized membrane protein